MMFKTKKRQKDKNAAKNIKRDSASTHVHMRRDMPSSCAQMYAFWMSLIWMSILIFPATKI